MKTEIRYGKRVKEQRLKKGWTQEHLAEVADVGIGMIHDAEGDLQFSGAGFGHAVTDQFQIFRQRMLVDGDGDAGRRRG